MMLRILIFVFCILIIETRVAQALTTELVYEEIGITSGFTGGIISLFGTKEQEGDIAIKVYGPHREAIVRRKDLVIGLWMNRESIRFREIPVYYDFAASRPLSLMASYSVLNEKQMGLDVLKLETSSRKDEESIRLFREALVRNKQKQGFFPLEPQKMTFMNDNFFRVDFEVPENVPTGQYIVETYLFQNGNLVDQDYQELQIRQAGLGAWIYKLAHTQGLIYGVLTIIIAFSSGFISNIIVQRD